MTDRYRLIGAIASPYSVKMRAIMRYRRLPFDWVLRTPELRAETAQVKPPLIPILRFPEDGSYHVDSTPLALALEARHPDARSIVPDDPGHAFLSYLLEDMADEWGTKIMFHYRWQAEADQAFCSRWIAREFMGPADDETLAQAAETFRARQIGRMPLVGCTPENAPLIEETYARVLAAFEGHVGARAFLFGGRPALADFGWFGQLYQCAIDPTPKAIMRESAPRTYHWLQRLDDASGVAGEWLAPEAPLPAAIGALLELAGEVYLPFLLANARALDAGDDAFETELLGRPYRQGVFKYQAKCLASLRTGFAALDAGARGRITGALDQAGCLAPLS